MDLWRRERENEAPVRGTELSVAKDGAQVIEIGADLRGGDSFFCGGQGMVEFGKKGKVRDPNPIPFYLMEQG